MQNDKPHLSVALPQETCAAPQSRHAIITDTYHSSKHQGRHHAIPRTNRQEVVTMCRPMDREAELQWWYGSPKLNPTITPLTSQEEIAERAGCPRAALVRVPRDRLVAGVRLIRKPRVRPARSPRQACLVAGRVIGPPSPNRYIGGKVWRPTPPAATSHVSLPSSAQAAYLQTETT